MAVYYVDSAGSNTAPYDTWAKAANALATIAAIDVAGDTIYCASTGSETSVAPSLSWAGTPTSPTRIISADKTSGAPPSTILAGYVVTGTGTGSNVTVQSANILPVYLYGLTFICANTGSGQGIILGSACVHEQCSFQHSAASGSAKISAGSSHWIGCSVKFGASGQALNTGGGFVWNGGSILSGGTSPTALITSGGGLIENVDLSNSASTLNISSDTAVGTVFTIRNCKLPAGWSGQLNSSTPGADAVFTLVNCDSAGTNYILHRQTQFGDVYSETTIVRSGGASDGSTPLSWKMVSLAASGTFPITALQTGEFVIWNNTTGSSRTLTVEGITDSVTNLQNNQVWLEVNYYGSSANPQGTLVSSAMANVLSTPADLTASTATWNGTGGMTNPNKFKLQVTFTPQLPGFFLATVKLCKASTTIYIDPKITVS